VFLEVARRIQWGTGFEQQHIDAKIGENLDRRSASGPGSNHDNIMHGAASQGLHDELA